VLDLFSKVSYVSDRRHPTEVAKDYGLVPFESHSRLLMIDLDKSENEAVFDRNFPVLCQHMPGVVGPFKTTSKSGKKHAYIQIPRMSIMERLALQAALGSDPMRELLGFLRAKGYRNDRAPQSPIWLFETPSEAVKVQTQLGLVPGLQESLASKVFSYGFILSMVGILTALVVSAINS
jgi:hypothetical protein